MILVLGAGLAGLSTAYHLRRRPFLVLEREREVGGLARSVDANGFVFDFTGHLLHLQSDAVKGLIDSLLVDDQIHLERSAWVHYQNTLVPYPFQVNTHELPIATRVDCVLKFAESLQRSHRLPPGSFDPPRTDFPLSFLNLKEPRGGYAKSFHDWAIATFGEGFARHFFLTYNEKNFAADLMTISADWVSWSVPKPSLEDVLRGALGESKKEFGYNPRFRYPKAGGIRRLPEAMGRAIEERGGTIERGAKVTRIDAKKKKLLRSNGAPLEYDTLVATNPLPELVTMIEGLPRHVRDAAERLRWCAVSSFNFGVKGKLDHGRHWIYYPEREFSFYRVGFPSNLAPSMAPDGTHSICAEVAYPIDRFPPEKDAAKRVLSDLVRAGVIAREATILTESRLDLPFAYVLFDEDRRAALPIVFEALLERDIIPVGRYGAWDYLSMETTILQGKETAEFLEQASE